MNDDDAVTDRFARELHAQGIIHWKTATDAEKEPAYEKARRFLAGDVSVLPWSYPPGWRPRQT